MAFEKPDQHDAHDELIALPPPASTTRPKSLQDDEPAKSTPAVPASRPSLFGSNYPGLDHVVLVRGRRGNWALAEGWRLENNLVFGVGLLELANAGDFAANIWNNVPVPIYAVVLMAIGGTAAGVICVFAFLDAIRAWHNIKFLRRQRSGLQAAKARQMDDEEGQQQQQTWHRSSLEVIERLTRRELRTEFLGRWCMDILMGGGAVLISIGTFMAIGGANHAVYIASNILSGYLGNAPLALFGLINSAWQVRIWMIMQHHKKAAVKANLSAQNPATALFIRKRCFNVQLFTIVNSITTIMGGVGSMLTPTFWWGYVILIPVIISSFFCNVWWRRKIGYDRPDLNSASFAVSTEGLIGELGVACRIKQIIQDHPATALSLLVTEREKPDGLMSFLIAHGIFELFCLRLVNEENLSERLAGPKATQLNLNQESVSALYHSHGASFWRVGEELLRIEGRVHFRHRIRFFTELLGEHLSYIHR